MQNILNRQKLSPILEEAFSIWPLSVAKGLTSAYIAYPIAERLEKRNIRRYVKELQYFYKESSDVREKIVQQRLFGTLDFASKKVPYYKDLFQKINFDPLNIQKDVRYLQDIPFLTKDIIREQGARLHSRPLEGCRHHICKTGGSTGISCHIYYDQNAADASAAVTLYAREMIGKNKSKSELHFACRFPDTPVVNAWFTREDFKCLAMNRTNIFFDRLDEVGLEEIIQILKRRKPFLIHAHPSTIYPLACYVEKRYGYLKLFEVFESSGELLESYQRDMISKALKCKVIDRYGLAELGVMAYQLGGEKSSLQVFESEGWVESQKFTDDDLTIEELIFTNFQNKLMPLIRYRSGDWGHVERNDQGTFISEVVGRIHDQVPIRGINYPTHHIQDILDHKIGGIQEFQIDLRTNPPLLKIVPEGPECIGHITNKVNEFWGNALELNFVKNDDFVRVGRHAKFRHVVTN
jgi:phenylacetate-CoA ligase